MGWSFVRNVSLTVEPSFDSTTGGGEARGQGLVRPEAGVVRRQEQDQGHQGGPHHLGPRPQGGALLSLHGMCMRVWCSVLGVGVGMTGRRVSIWERLSCMHV